jgi:hypothetical protein
MTGRLLCWFIFLLVMLSGRAEAQEKLSPLPCSDPSPQCIQQLGDLAVAGSLEIRTLNKAIEYQKKKMWSSWLNADGFNPVAVGFRVLRNVIGGGDRAALKLEIARLEQRRSAVEDALRQSVAVALVDLDAVRRRKEQAIARLRSHEAREQLMLIGYRLGEGSTEQLLQLYQRRDELRAEITAATTLVDQLLSRLQASLDNNRPPS